MELTKRAECGREEVEVEMLRNKAILCILGVVALVSFAACAGDDEGEGSNGGTGGAAGTAGAAGTGGVGGTGGSAGTGATAGQAGEAGSAGSGSTGGTAGSAGGAGEAGAGGSSGATVACDELVIDLHEADTWYFTLADMTEHDAEPASWDVMMGKTGSGPWITLREGVEAIDLGSGEDFVDVIEAPDSGYDADADLIGGDWKSGGAGETGYTMSENVYVLKLADDTYAKLMVTSAEAGAITIDAFHQSDGTRDLACTQP
jgi:hypothetical protein